MFIIEQIINGISLGMVYGLIAVGYSLVFGILKLVNFSHGSVYAFGAHMALMFITFRFGLIIGVLLSVILTGILGILIDWTALRPLRDKNSLPISALITTIGISYIIQNGLMIVFGSERKSFPRIIEVSYITISGLMINSQQIMIFSTCLILMIILTFIIYKTKTGLAMRGIEQNRKAANLMGINVNFIIAFTFFLGGVSACIGAVLISSYYQVVYPNMGVVIGMKAFAAAVLGGIGILHGSIIGGLIVGISENLATAFLGGNYRDAIAFIILILVLIFKPVGIFGKKGIIKV
mgnify:CR=1 FL=1